MDDRLSVVSRAGRLLIACDFDGVIAEIAPTPGSARARADVMEALRGLAALERTDVAVVSGRGLADLRRSLPEIPGMMLAGSHGAEVWLGDGPWGVRGPGTVEGAGDGQALIDELRRRVGSVVAQARVEGVLVEIKPLGAAVHYRLAGDDAAGVARVLGAVRSALEGLHRAGVREREGKMVAEFVVSDAHKGRALTTIARRVGATAVLFIGDDRTDEDAFGALGEHDLGVKVGEGDTLAFGRVADPAAVAAVLKKVRELRGEHLLGQAGPAIESLAMLSDQRTLGLVDAAGAVVWLCLPRTDSPALFASLVGGAAAGLWRIGPGWVGADAGGKIRRYVEETLMLETGWGGAGRQQAPWLRVTDYLDASAGRAFQRAGRSDLVRVVEGHGRVAVRFAPRLDFGRSPTRLRVAEGGGLVIEGAATPAVLRVSTGLMWTVLRDGAHDTAVAEFEVGGPEGPGEVCFELRWGAGSLEAASISEPARRAQTHRHWSGWSASLRLPALRADLVQRSALTLRALTYGPTGAIAAAGTTSLPEWPGGVRNWDYRYCWPRDAAMAALALARLGNTGSGMKLLDWLLGVLDDLDSPEELQPIYTVAGRELGAEGEIGELAGYEGSRPVRVGNAAAQQVQLDVFGPIIELADELVRIGAPLTPEHWRLIESVVGAVQRRWEEPDHGIWEIRGERRHHVHSKVMCWLAVDRGARLSRALTGHERPGWAALRERIAADVLERGWSERLGAYGAVYGVDELDAAALMVGLSGLVAADDPRLALTVEAVERSLVHGSGVLRYVNDDGLPGREGAFFLCMGWLVEALVLVGRVEQARQRFDDLCGAAGALGLYGEQHLPATARESLRGRHLGNFPQAYSHVAVINAAVVLERAGRSSARDDGQVEG